MEQMTHGKSVTLGQEQLKKVHLGCGSNLLKGWLNIDFWPHLSQEVVYLEPNGIPDTVFLNYDLRQGIPYASGRAAVVYHCHLLEHLPYFDGLLLLERCFEALEVGGLHRIVVPNLEAFARSYLSDDAFLLDQYRAHALHSDADRYSTKGAVFMGMLHNHDHRWGYDWDTLRWALARVGFSKIRRCNFQESDIAEIREIEPYVPLRALESLCVECYK